MYCYVLKLLFLTPQSYIPKLAIKKSLANITDEALGVLVNYDHVHVLNHPDRDQCSWSRSLPRWQPRKTCQNIIDKLKLFTYKTEVRCRNIRLDLFRSHILIKYINFITEIFGDVKWRSGPTRLPLGGFDGDLTRWLGFEAMLCNIHFPNISMRFDE